VGEEAVSLGFSSTILFDKGTSHIDAGFVSRSDGAERPFSPNQQSPSGAPWQLAPATIVDRLERKARVGDPLNLSKCFSR
jgi:hypothetical protein